MNELELKWARKNINETHWNAIIKKKQTKM